MKKIELPAWVQIGILIVMAIGLGITIGYNIRSEKISSLEAQISTFNFAKKAELLKLLSSLQLASAQLKDSLILAEQYEELKKQFNSTKEKNTKLVSENDRLRKKLEYLSRLVNTQHADSDIFELKRGNVKYLFGNDIVITWTYQPVSSGIILKLNNKAHFIDIGEYATFEYEGEKYKL